uniref:6-cysteine protein n=1 Tax=Strongyloides venezuelensis TaxID=75913 RepID=A0A0K0F1I8_STRVS
MTKLLYINLKFIIPTCILFGFITTKDVFNAKDLELKYYRYDSTGDSYLGTFKGEVKENVKFKFYDHDVTKNLILYKIHIPKEFSTYDLFNSEFIMTVKNIRDTKGVYTHNFKPEVDIIFLYKDKHYDGAFTCKLYLCHIGIVYHCPGGSRNCDNKYEIETFFYIGLTTSHEYNNLVLQYIPKTNNTNTFSVIACPTSTWLTQNSNAEFIESEDNAVTRVTFSESSKKYTLKYIYCHNIDIKSFVKCGYVKQMFLPPIDVGYQCYKYYQQKPISIRNGHEKEIYMVTQSNGELTCNNAFMDKPSSPVIAFLPPENNFNNANSFKISRFIRNMKFYHGHRLHYINLEHYDYDSIERRDTLGYSNNYEAKCITPTLNATLRLQINGIIREFDNKVDSSFGKIDIYSFDRKEIKDALIGCHAVPDEMKHPAFSDFYALYYSTSLLMFDETSEKAIEVKSSQQLVSNKKYKCILKDGNSKNKKPSYIKETVFIINFTGEYMYWIIFVIFILVTALLIVGLVIYKKIQSKKKKRSSSSSTSSSISSSQSTTNSSTVVSEVTNVPILQDKNVAAKSTNMGKNVVSKNANISNKVTNPGQKVDAKNSNSKLINQVKIAPKKVVGKNSNPKKISNMDDSVFKVK